MMRNVASGACMVLTLAVFGSIPVSAQTNVESNAGIELDFENPGARSLALGGAFVGLADDATAAFTNPAGLSFISRKEASAEGRFWSFATPFTSGGRLDGSPTLQGIDQTAGLTTSESHQSASAPSFLSFVYPGARWAIAVYRQQLSDFNYAASSQGPFYVNLQNGDARLLPYQATLDVKIARYGVSGSIKVGDKASIGLGVFLYDFSITSDTRRFGIVTSAPGLYATPNFSTVPINEETQNGSDRRAGVNVGFTATPNSHVQLGGVFRQGAHFQFVTADLTGGQTSSTGTFTVPDVYGLGLTLRLTDPLKVMIDYDRVRYSQIADNFTSFFPALAGFSAQPQDFKVNDANEVHLGAEYVFLKLPKPLAVRAGSWYDPDHAIRYEPVNTQTADPYDLATFRAGKSVVHGTFGAGIVIGQVEINAAGDLSPLTKTASISTVIRF
jgi:long-chain fatty acid transport protein